MLVISHTPKRNPTEPLTENSLAGSKRIANFADSMFAIGRSTKGESVRYIKQIKTRMGILEHGIDNVLTGQVVQYDDGFLCFEPSVTCDERHLLDTKSDSRLSEVAQLRSEGLSIRKIAEQLGVSKSVIGRMVTDYRLDKAEVIAPGNA